MDGGGSGGRRLARTVVVHPNRSMMNTNANVQTAATMIALLSSSSMSGAPVLPLALP